MADLTSPFYRIPTTSYNVANNDATQTSKRTISFLFGTLTANSTAPFNWKLVMLREGMTQDSFTMIVVSIVSTLST